MSIEILSKNVKYLRKSRGITQKEMAKILGIGVGSLSKLEKGKLPPRLCVDVLFIMERAFGIKSYRFLCEEIEKIAS